MNEIKFVKFGSLEGKKCIQKKFPGVKDSDLVYIEDNGKFSIKYIVTAIYDDEFDTVSILDSSKNYVDMDEETANALNNISKDFTIYSPASIEKKAKKAAKESGLPDLKGSAKQKKWAETIRAEKLAMLAGDPTMGTVWAWYAQNYTKAAEWIDARFMDEQQLKRNMEQLKSNMEMKLRFKR